MKMFYILLGAFMFFYNFQLAEMALGFDTINPVSVAQFQKFKNAGYSFYIARILKTTGQVDSVGLANINKAKQAGFYDVDAYLFPCNKGSTCPTATNQVLKAINMLRSQNLQVGVLWFDIELASGWSKNITRNRLFIDEMKNAAMNNGYYSIGIYASANSWNSIVGKDWTTYANYPLWWANYNKVADVSTGWQSFGGWYLPSIHEYDQNLSDFGVTYYPNVK